MNIEESPLKKKALKRIAVIAASSLALLLLFVGAGVAYVWYSGQQEPVKPNAIATPVAPAPIIEKAPTKPADNAPVSVSIQSLTSPIAPGANAGLTIRTLANAVCGIKVVYDQTPSKDSGLTEKVADDFGMVSWSWTVDATAPLGKWPVTVTCERNKKSAVAKGELEVAR